MRADMKLLKYSDCDLFPRLILKFKKMYFSIHVAEPNCLVRNSCKHRKAAENYSWDGLAGSLAWVVQMYVAHIVWCLSIMHPLADTRNTKRAS